jgi:hypothetical protein
MLLLLITCKHPVVLDTAAPAAVAAVAAALAALTMQEDGKG